MLIFSPLCLENPTFWFPAFARMTNWKGNHHHKRPVASPVFCIPSPVYGFITVSAGIMVTSGLMLKS